MKSFFPGKGVGVELLAKDGVALAAFQHERMHEYSDSPTDDLCL